MQKQFISGLIMVSVSIEMDTDKPYLYYEQHKRQYPPGHLKKGEKHKGGKKGKK